MYDVRRLWPPFLLAALVFSARPLPAAPPRTIAVDVLVVGSTPAGIAAAAAAARAGARVHLVEALPKMGGVITWAWLTTWDMNLTPDGAHLTRGIFWEYYRALGLSFDLEEAVNKLTWHIYRERLVGSTTNAPLVRVLSEQRRLVGAEFDDRDWQRPLTVRARQVIDATDDADLAAAAGVSYVLGRPGPGGVPWMQAAGLIFRVTGVQWQELAADLLRRKGAGAEPAAWGINGRAAWGYQPMMKRYRPTQPETMVLGLNLALQRDGSVLINSLQIFGVNGVDPASVEAGMARGRTELPPLVAFLRETIPGFAQAQLGGHAPMLYIRETRHIRGMYTLEVEDIFANRDFPDRIAVASYPIDIHPYVPGWVSPYAPVRHVYTIPLRALVPVEVDNLLVASRAFSATSEAAGSARVVPTTMALGQAAGVTAAVCARRGCTPREVVGSPGLLAEVQRTLRAQGATIGGEGTP
ncbi:MAG: FAD-dependent oxidoreductase [Armatimonadota bacterium]|nr:FAD-dependent oxidoreductase [Armatimonadota bacterium]MDR7426930.1 FAD-dependent oxidoreductase [Armatimonadota bacterium]MDR7464982.1 FAD-dependent oxidoreductase [Armatimonadota bacterium]MDR7470544.1 FAD-dependent oxidoreductase [Armatimonadota bacterium]MDR7474195.1 FAD-dependent oxidoreductase [Armatimonadota bacterium]